MTSFLLSLASISLSFLYYLFTWLTPSVLSERLTLLGVVISFFGLHIGLKILIVRDGLHVVFLAISASLYTLSKSFSDDNTFLYVQVILHGIVLLVVTLTIPIKNENA